MMRDHARSLTRRDTLRYAALSSGAILAGGLSIVGSAAASTPIVLRFEGETVLTGDVNPCRDEDILVSATIKFVFQEHPHGDGWILSFTANGTGVGERSGHRWRWNDRFQEVAVIESAQHATIVFGPLVLASLDQQENIIFDGIFLITVNAEGEPVHVELLELDPEHGPGTCIE